MVSEIYGWTPLYINEHTHINIDRRYERDRDEEVPKCMCMKKRVFAA